MDQDERENLKFDLLNMHWTEELHDGLKEIDEEDAKSIVESMDEEEITYKVNPRRFQEDYIADYLEFLWEISEVSFWKHVKTTFAKEVGLLWSDNMFYFDQLCDEEFPQDVLIELINFIVVCDPDCEQDINLLGCILKEQIANFDRLPEIKKIVSSLPKKQKTEANKRINLMIQMDCDYR
ncbi:MAG: hypothetical protein K8R67_03760 [Desulfobacteraceae bacterium]|nr:hypothetical protein [Desulfobacteraceae bacterium]